MNPQSSITIFTDGASRGNPGPGGFGAVLIFPSPNEKNNEVGIMNYEVKELGGREEYTTNNRMELRAAIEALRFVSSLNAKRLTLYADSSYLINGITKWIFGWQKNGWKTKAKKDVENRDLWDELTNITRGKDIQWKYVGGHVGVAGNVRCDEIATSFADGKPLTLYFGVLENYGIRNILDMAVNSKLAEKKQSGRTRSNVKAYSYVSLVNGRVATHKTWAECEQRVKGKNARYKKALSADEEQKLIAEWGKR
ncbi:MAG TPA: ribonuclease HI [Candidatus Taylorbacteria bacterium]|nr:ribonuclease HI [Candidatus Taylorbacteria bacterium]